MESNSQVIYQINLPTYTTEESMVRTKIQLKIGLKDTDISVLANDLITNIQGNIDFSDANVRRYLDNKYPGWYASDKLIEKVKRLRSTEVE